MSSDRGGTTNGVADPLTIAHMGNPDSTQNAMGELTSHGRGLPVLQPKESIVRHVLLLTKSFVLITALLAAVANSATFSPAKISDVRRLNIVRTYEIPVEKGNRTVATVPALMSFWGATNQQVVLNSSFTYSVKPDKITVTADDRSKKRRNYELTWESAQVDKITVTQKLTVKISRLSILQTAAKLPYPTEVSTIYAGSLASTEDINLDNAKLDNIVKAISGKSPWAEETVELVCDWVNDNIAFKSGAPGDSDTVLKNKYGNCGGMTNVACAILRKMGIPAETVSAIFIGSNGGHAFMEVYFPDAGWVFYDLSNANRGFKSLDCLLTVGWCIRVGDGNRYKWIKGVFLDATDVPPYKEKKRYKKKLRATPKNENVTGVTVLHVKTSARVKVRHLPINSLIMDLSISPGKRDYSSDDPRSSSRPATRPATTASKPSSMPDATGSNSR